MLRNKRLRAHRKPRLSLLAYFHTLHVPGKKPHTINKLTPKNPPFTALSLDFRESTTNPWTISTRTADSKGCEEWYLSYIVPRSNSHVVEPTPSFCSGRWYSTQDLQCGRKSVLKWNNPILIALSREYYLIHSQNSLSSGTTSNTAACEH